MKRLDKRRWIATISVLTFLLIAVALLALNIGSERIDLLSAIRGIDPQSHAILYSSRLPRVLLAMIVGIALASAGSTYQSILRNPLADPFIMGISGGAALGSIVGLTLNLPFSFASAFGFLGSMLAIVIIFSIAARDRKLPSIALLLTGVIFNAFSFAFILFINAVVTIEEAYQILFMLIGNLDAVDYLTIAIVGGFTLVGFITLILISHKINLISLGEDEAFKLGLNPFRTRVIAFVASSMMVGAVVSVSGLIGFVGLFIPHAIRLTIGADNRLLIPASGIAGGIFLIMADTLARTLLMKIGFDTILPVGVITALIGGPVFAILLRRSAYGRY